MANTAEPPFLVAHSLGCLLVAQWAARHPDVPVKGAFLVAVPDASGPNFPARAASFRDVPEVRLRFPSLIVASANDPFGSLAYSRLKARTWGSGLIIAGALGHLNEDSGLENWPLGRMLFEAFQTGTGQPSGL